MLKLAIIFVGLAASTARRADDEVAMGWLQRVGLVRNTLARALPKAAGYLGATRRWSGHPGASSQPEDAAQLDAGYRSLVSSGACPR